MPLPAGEVARSLYAVWRLLHWDGGAIRYFDGTRGAAIRSFWAAAIGAPLYAVIAVVSYGPPASGDPVRATAVLAVGYVVTWTAFPLAMLYVADVLGRSHQYFRFLAAYNWATVVQHLIVLTAAVAAALAPPALAAPSCSARCCSPWSMNGSSRAWRCSSGRCRRPAWWRWTSSSACSST